MVKHNVRMADSDEIPVREKTNFIEKIVKKRNEVVEYRENAMNFISYIVRVSQIMMSEINLRRLEEYNSDLFIDVDPGIDSHEFNKAKIAIDAGYEAALGIRNELFKKLKKD